jgi:hypothetical protein
MIHDIYIIYDSGVFRFMLSRYWGTPIIGRIGNSILEGILTADLA